MTTTVTVKTGDCPAMAIVEGDYHHSELTRSYWSSTLSWTLSRTFIEPYSERRFVGRDMQTVFVSELPERATRLPGYMPPADDV